MLEKWQARKMLEDKSVKNLRTWSGMTQKAFAEYFGMSKRTVEEWEGGRRSCPDYLLELMYYKMEKEGILEANTHK